MSAEHGPVAGAERPRRRSAESRTRLALLVPGRGDRWHWVALLGGLVALGMAVLLPFAPVKVNEPVVTWPSAADSPENTSLLLTTYRPDSLDVVFSCHTARRAAATPNGLVLTTVAAQQIDSAPGPGLRIGTVGSRLTVDAVGVTLHTEVIPAGDCSYRVAAVEAGTLTVSRDGRPLASIGPGPTPQIEVLITELRTLPGGVDDLSVRVQVQDQFSSSPSPVKYVMLVVGALGLAAAVVAGVRLSRTGRQRTGIDPAATRPPGRGDPATGGFRRVLRQLGVVDVVVVLVLVAWVFLAPQTDDDGYYAAMARNFEYEGYIANYIQLYNQSFTPFTWFYVGLSKWQDLIGTSPVEMRIPALVFAIVTWGLLRYYVTGLLTQADRSGYWTTGPRRLLVPFTLAAAFLGFWLPHSMPIRPEAVVAMCATGTLVLVALVRERRTLVLVIAAIAVGSVGFAVHPTGFVALAPLLAGVPTLWSVVRGPTLGETTARLAAALSPVLLAAMAGFADGSLHDFRQSQDIFRSIQEQDSWVNEIYRYEFLFNQIPMGNYAKRTAVVLVLVALIWFLVLAVASRVRELDVPPRLMHAGFSILLAFFALWATPSKWTHHFASLSGLGAAFLAPFLLLVPAMVMALVRDAKLPWPPVAAGLGSVVIAASLAAHGPNDWPYSWNFGLPNSPEPPHLGPLEADTPVLWALGAGVVFAVLWRLLGNRAPDHQRFTGVIAAPLVACVALVLMLGYLVGSFTVAAARTLDTYSLGAANLKDPGGGDCLAAKAVDVLDEGSARPLTRLGPAPAPRVFVPNAGFFPSSPPPATAGTGAATEVYGSRVLAPGLKTPEQTIGVWTSGWYRAPQVDAGSELAVLVSGRIGDGNSLTVQYGTDGPGGPRVIGTRTLEEFRRDTTDGSPTAVADAVAWRTVALPRPELFPGADSVRLVAEDSSANVGGWFAFTGPSVQDYTSLDRYVPRDAVTAVGWQINLSFPCFDLPRQQNGVAEPIDYAVLWGLGPLGGLEDGSWQKERGGFLARNNQIGVTFQPVTRFHDFPSEQRITVFRFDSGVADDGYRLERTERTRRGW